MILIADSGENLYNALVKFFAAQEQMSAGWCWNMTTCQIRSFVDRETESELFRSILSGTKQIPIVIAQPSGSGKTALLIHFLGIANELGYAAVYVPLIRAAGFAGNLLEIERLVADATRRISPAAADSQARLLATRLQASINPLRPEISGTRTTNAELLQSFRYSLANLAKGVLPKKTLLFIDDVDGTLDEGSYEDLVRTLCSLAPTVIAVLGTPCATLAASEAQRIELGPLGSDAVAAMVSLQENCFLGANEVDAIWGTYCGVPLATAAALRVSIVRNLSQPPQDNAGFGSLDHLFEDLFTVLESAETAVARVLAHQLMPITPGQLSHLLGWPLDVVERILRERPLLSLLLRQDGPFPEKLSLFHPEFGTFVKHHTSLEEQTKIHRRTAGLYWSSSPLDDYAAHPLHLGLCIQHLIASRTPDLIDFLTMNEVIVLLRAWGMADVAIPAIHLALDGLNEFNPLRLDMLEPNTDLPLFSVPLGPNERAAADYRLHRELAYFLGLQGDQQGAIAARAEAVRALAQSANLKREQLLTLEAMLWADDAQDAMERGDLIRAETALNKQASLYRAVKGSASDSRLGLVRHNLGLVYKRMGRYSDAQTAFSEALGAQVESNEAAQELVEIGAVQYLQGYYAEAIETLGRAARLLSKGSSRDQYSYAVALGYLGAAYFEAERGPEALEATERALAIFRTVGSEEDVAMAIRLLEQISTLDGEGADSAR